jgi:hypothetical protein
MKAIGIFVCLMLGFAALMGLTWVIQGNDFFLTQYFSPKYEDVRRETFEHSHAYNQGMIQELQNMQFEYVKATPEQKQVLGSLILHRVGDYNEAKLPNDLYGFVKDVRHDQLYGTTTKPTESK